MNRCLVLNFMLNVLFAPPLSAQQVVNPESKTACKSCVSARLIHKVLIDLQHDHQLQLLLRRVSNLSKTRKSQISEARSRMRYAAWLPDLTLSASRGIRDSARYNSDLTPYGYISDALVLRASLHFSLPKLIASSSETYWHSQRESVDKASMQIKERVIDLYYQRQAILLEQKLSSDTSPEKELERRHLEDKLFLLTGVRL
jgi:hypothetical protein